ncbi:AmiS/UreI family transporter [Nonomuraea sp. NPDC046570]|uniref:AmiS/UreI family transporter n=1 Tax=Nonomuraea sp. NPDC046570 TaxID=3155255 RepID=UPI0033C0C1BE
MGSVGLLYVGAVLFMNALLLLGKVEGKAAAPINLFVGTLQVVTPTFLIMTADGDLRTIMGASGLYLFGFTYLYVGIGLLAGLDTTGVGWFSLFVAIAALVYAAYSAFTLQDYPFAVIWALWSFLWLLFFLVLGLKRAELTRYTGWVTLIEAWLTAVIPAFLLLTGLYTPSVAFAVALAVVCVVAFVALWLFARSSILREREPSHA